MLPPAPPMFSMKIDHLRVSVRRWEMTRDRMSVPPPAGNGTMNRIGFETGQSREAAGDAMAPGARSPRQKSRDAPVRERASIMAFPRDLSIAGYGLQDLSALR